MNKFVLIIFTVVLFSCQANKPANSKIETVPAQNISTEFTKFEINEEMHNFGSLQSGEIVTYSFKLTNTGAENLYIKSIETDCNCVKTEFSKEPVLPGDLGIIEVEFDSSGLWGKQFKTIEIRANVEKPKQLVIFAEVQNEKIDIKY